MTNDPAPISPPNAAIGPTLRWLVYYTDDRIVVTNWQITTSGGARFRTSELSEMLRVLTYAHPGRRVALFVGGVEVAVSIPAAIAYRSASIVLAGLLATLGVAVGVLVDSRRNPRWLELRATYRGQDVVLYSSRRLDEFERVRWAVIRACENSRIITP
jgi:hypothetical protein